MALRRQAARPDGGFAAQPNEGVKVGSLVVQGRSTIIHQPSWSLGVRLCRVSIFGLPVDKLTAPRGPVWASISGFRLTG
ncbi:hypothetical protein [Spirosoma pollinicola]|uniref:hypothetical protein n=1 Tax=Spirosoma pollinicola TaxID=2057025 RepID=UPI0012FD8107|nr:hypothetical protein [Spirosoma pollinicola]